MEINKAGRSFMKTPYLNINPEVQTKSSVYLNPNMKIKIVSSLTKYYFLGRLSIPKKQKLHKGKINLKEQKIEDFSNNLISF